jgi:hypothetical protein
VGVNVSEFVGVDEGGLVWVLVHVIDGVHDSRSVDVEEGLVVGEEVPVAVPVIVPVEVVVAVYVEVGVQLL